MTIKLIRMDDNIRHFEANEVCEGPVTSFEFGEFYNWPGGQGKRVLAISGKSSDDCPDVPDSVMLRLHTTCVANPLIRIGSLIHVP